MRILMVVPKYPFPVVGGLERQAHELSKCLLERGNAVLVLSSRFDRIQQPSEQVEGVEVHRIPWADAKWQRFVLMPWRLFTTLRRLRTKADLVHIHNITWFGAFTTVVAKGLGLPVMMKLPNFGQFGIRAERTRAFGWLRRILFRTCDSIVCMTPESFRELNEIGFPRSRILHATNGIPVRAAPGASFGKTSTLGVVFVGRLSPEKGLNDLLYAWAILQGQPVPAAVLRLVGDGPQAEELRQLASDLGISTTVEFVGHSNDVPAELARSDIFVLPSYAEGNSNAVLEAMREGLPIVATSVGGAAVQLGAAGDQLLVNPGDRAGIAERLRRLLTDEPFREQIGSAMRSRAKEMFTMDAVAAVYERAYKLIESGHRDEVALVNPLFDERALV